MEGKQAGSESLAITEGSEDTAKYIMERIREYNLEQAPGDGPLAQETVYLALRNGQGRVVGGINATLNLLWGRCHVDIFWIEERFRKGGYGTRLLQEVERRAKEKGCRLVQLDTFGFQAPGFYRKNGYEQFGVLEDFPPGHSQYFFKKWLND
ncbi:MAG TPA: GNAT family N-acetyltransferase [Selenomonadales bacterium]|nr:GNAT family N-acetyltransferase [Selenomonadales bacterium]